MTSSNLHHIEREKAESSRLLVSSAWPKRRERAADLLKISFFNGDCWLKNGSQHYSNSLKTVLIGLERWLLAHGTCFGKRMLRARSGLVLLVIVKMPRLRNRTCRDLSKYIFLSRVKGSKFILQYIDLIPQASPLPPNVTYLPCFKREELDCPTQIMCI